MSWWANDQSRGTCQGWNSTGLGVFYFNSTSISACVTVPITHRSVLAVAITASCKHWRPDNCGPIQSSLLLPFFCRLETMQETRLETDNKEKTWLQLYFGQCLLSIHSGFNNCSGRTICFRRKTWPRLGAVLFPLPFHFLQWQHNNGIDLCFIT